MISMESGKRIKAAEHFDMGSMHADSFGDAMQSQRGLQSNLREFLNVWYSWDGMSTCWGASNHAGDDFDSRCHAFDHGLNANARSQGWQPYFACGAYYDNPITSEQDMPHYDITTGVPCLFLCF